MKQFEKETFYMPLYIKGATYSRFKSKKVVSKTLPNPRKNKESFENNITLDISENIAKNTQPKTKPKSRYVNYNSEPDSDYDDDDNIIGVSTFQNIVKHIENDKREKLALREKKEKEEMEKNRREDEKILRSLFGRKKKKSWR